MCRYILDIFDLDELDPKEKKKLTKHLQGRKKELLAQVRNVDRALKHRALKVAKKKRKA